MKKLLSVFIVISLAILSTVSKADATSHGLAHHNTELKYKSNFSHFDYTKADAPKGGRLTLSAVGGFDSLNPFALKGETPFLLGNLIFESITQRSYDEPFAQYGLIAKEISVAKDEMSVTYKIRDNASFSDGSPITASDIRFSFNKLTSADSQPFYKFYYMDVKEVEVLGPKKVKIVFSTQNPELKLIIGEMTVLQEKFYSKGDFSRDFKKKVMGSGPYVVKDYALGKFILYKRNPNYWGKDLPLNAGKYNFDEIMVKYYKNRTTQLEGLKAGEFDFLAVNSSKDWAKSLEGTNFKKGYIKKELLEHSNNAGMQGFALNTRLHIFSDRNVRKALALTFDFQWSNKNLFYGQYKPYSSYFAGSELAATGLPSEKELKLLLPLKKDLPEEVFTTPMQPVGNGFKDMRSRLREAKKLLNKAGWSVKNGSLINKDGMEFKFTVLLHDPAFGRIIEPWITNIRKLGIKADYEVKDPSIYIERVQKHGWDVIVQSYGQSSSPGNEQRDYWHSSTADTEGSRNHMGIKNKAIDKLIDLVINASTREDLLISTHALDRALWHGYYMVPNWYIDKHRVVYWDKFGRPDNLPKYYYPNALLDFWWIDTDKPGN